MIHRPKRFYRHMNREIAMQIRDLYFARRMTQKQLGELYGVSQNTVCRIVSGRVWA